MAHLNLEKVVKFEKRRIKFPDDFRTSVQPSRYTFSHFVSILIWPKTLEIFRVLIRSNYLHIQDSKRRQMKIWADTLAAKGENEKRRLRVTIHQGVK